MPKWSKNELWEATFPSRKSRGPTSAFVRFFGFSVVKEDGRDYRYQQSEPQSLQLVGN
jgi:hypothetical protein